MARKTAAKAAPAPEPEETEEGGGAVRGPGEMHELFFELNREFGMTLLIVTHNPELAAKTGRRLRMADGILLEGDAAA